MRKVKVACVQMHCSADRKENVDKAAAFTEEAARAGARLVLLPELFERRTSARNAGTSITATPNRRRKTSPCDGCAS